MGVSERSWGRGLVWFGSAGVLIGVVVIATQSWSDTTWRGIPAPVLGIVCLVAGVAVIISGVRFLRRTGKPEQRSSE